MEPYIDEQDVSSRLGQSGLPSSSQYCQLPKHWIWSQQSHASRAPFSVVDVQEKLVGHVIGDSKRRVVHVSTNSDMEGNMMITY